MELCFECYDEEERKAAADLLDQKHIPYQLKDYQNAEGCDVFEIWVEPQWQEAADRVLEQEEDAQRKAEEVEEKAENPPCPRCYKQSVLCVSQKVKNGEIRVYQCSACGYKWPKK